MVLLELADKAIVMEEVVDMVKVVLTVVEVVVQVHLQVVVQRVLDREEQEVQVMELNMVVELRVQQGPVSQMEVQVVVVKEDKIQVEEVVEEVTSQIIMESPQMVEKEVPV